MRKHSSILLIALLALVGVGCDSNDNETTGDTEKFVGNWALTGVSDAGGDAMEAFQAMFTSVTLDNATDGDFTITVVPVAGPSQTISGSYSVNESAGRFTLTVVQDGTPVNLNFDYVFSNSDNTVTLTSDPTTVIFLNALFLTDLEGQAVITVSRVS